MRTVKLLELILFFLLCPNCDTKKWMSGNMRCEVWTKTSVFNRFVVKEKLEKTVKCVARPIVDRVTVKLNESDIVLSRERPYLHPFSWRGHFHVLPPGSECDRLRLLLPSPCRLLLLRLDELRFSLWSMHCHLLLVHESPLLFVLVLHRRGS